MTEHNSSRSTASGSVDQTEKPLVRDDGSKVATKGSPSGETETEKVQREEAKLPNRGISPDYTDPVDGDGTAVVDHPPQNEHDEQLITEEFSGLDNDLVNVETFNQPAWDDDGLAPTDEDEDQPGLPGDAALEKSNTREALRAVPQ